MHLNPYGQDAVLLAVDLANHPPTTPTELGERCLDAGVVLGHPATPADLVAANDLLTAWNEIVDTKRPAERAALLNALLAAATSHPRLTDHTGGWHLHFRDDDLPLSGVLRALVATGTALHLTGRGMDRLGRCALPDCTRAYADVSRGGRQRYCSPPCANRDAVRRHRARTATARPDRGSSAARSDRPDTPTACAPPPSPR